MALGHQLDRSGDARSAAAPAAMLAAMPCCLVSEVPRLADDYGDARAVDATAPQRTAALTGSYHLGASVLVSWLRGERGADVEVMVGGASLVQENGSVHFPPGARGQPIADPGERLRRFAHWGAVAGVVDALAPDRATGPERLFRPALEDAVISAWSDPFAWLVVAVPVPLAEIEKERAHLARQIPIVRAQAANNQKYAVGVERMETHHRELQRAELGGLWAAYLLAGADEPEAASRLCALTCSSLDLAGLPYRLRPGPVYGSLEEALGSRVEDPDAGSYPVQASSELLSAVAFPPRRELAGLRTRTPPTFDVTPETSGAVTLGTVVTPSLGEAGSFSLSHDALNRHAFVCGATGSGKSQTIRTLLEQLSRAPEPVPWLVVEPAKAEYRKMAGRLAGSAPVIVIRPGATEAPAVGINPLEPLPGFPLQTHLDLTRALFIASFQADEPFPQVLSAALTRCYEELGWDLTLGESRVDGVTPRWPTLGDLQQRAQQVVMDIGYGADVTRNVRGFIDVRLSSLRHGTPGRFFEGGHPIDMSALLERNVVLEIEDLGDDRDKAFLIGAIIVRLVEHLRLRGAVEDGEPPLRHLTVIEEAHRLLRRTDTPGPAAHAVELFASLLAEVRAYGEGILVAEQIPSKLIPDVIKNTAVKVVHRLPALDDRQAVGATMNLTDAQSEYIVSVERGRGAVFSEGMDYPALVQMPLGESRESAQGVGVEPPLAGRFSAACGACCTGDGPCTLRQMRTAELLLERDEGIVVWVELVVMAHLIGVPSPEPGEALAAQLRAIDARTRECALAHAVEAAVASRSGAISRQYSPAALARHVAEVLETQLRGNVPPCAEEVEWRWQVGPFQWNDVYTKLVNWRDAGKSNPHPDTDSWEELYGLSLDAESPDAQIAMLMRLRATARASRGEVLFGSARPSAFETAVGSGRDESGWQNALAQRIEGLTFHRKWRWPLGFLKGPPASKAQGG